MSGWLLGVQGGRRNEQMSTQIEDNESTLYDATVVGTCHYTFVKTVERTCVNLELWTLLRMYQSCY